MALVEVFAPPSPLLAPQPPAFTPAQTFVPKATRSTSSRSQRLQRQLTWRRARGMKRDFQMSLAGTEFTTRQIPCGEVTGFGTGATVWDSAVVLAHYLEKQVALGNLATPEKVLELGSGNAMFGMVSAILWPSASILLTDQTPLLPLMRENVDLNVEAIPHIKAKVVVEELNWGDPTEHAGRFDLILASDCVYPMAPLDLFVDSLVDLCKGRNKDEIKIILSMEHRYHEHEAKFFVLAGKHFDINKVPHADHDDDYEAEDIDIYIITPRVQ